MKIDIDFAPHTFDPDVIMNSGQVFRFEKKENEYIVNSGNHNLRFTYDDLSSQLQGDGDDEAFWREYFDSDADYAMYNDVIKKNDDKFLKSALDNSLGMRILRQDLWETIISYMISQNNNIPKIKKSIGILIDRYSDADEFPTAEALSNVPLDELKQGTMLGYRAEYISEISKKVAVGEINIDDFKCDKFQESYDKLIAVKGIGPKVANCICLYGLHHMSGYPIDTWMKKIIEEDYSNYEQKEYMNYINESYSGFQGYVQQLQFYYKRNQ